MWQVRLFSHNSTKCITICYTCISCVVLRSACNGSDATGLEYSWRSSLLRSRCNAARTTGVAHRSRKLQSRSCAANAANCSHLRRWVEITPKSGILSRHAGFAFAEEEFRAKKSELRLYCDLLLQQVHSVRDCISGDAPPTSQVRESMKSLLQWQTLSIFHCDVSLLSSLWTKRRRCCRPLATLSFRRWTTACRWATYSRRAPVRSRANTNTTHSPPPHVAPARFAKEITKLQIHVWLSFIYFLNYSRTLPSTDRTHDNERTAPESSGLLKGSATYHNSRGCTFFNSRTPDQQSACNAAFDFHSVLLLIQCSMLCVVINHLIARVDTCLNDIIAPYSCAIITLSEMKASIVGVLIFADQPPESRLRKTCPCDVASACCACPSLTPRLHRFVDSLRRVVALWRIEHLAFNLSISWFYLEHRVTHLVQSHVDKISSCNSLHVMCIHISLYSCI